MLCTPKQYDMDLRDSRELALQRLARFCRSGFVSVTDFRHAPLRIFAAHECAALVDPSMATKMTVGVVEGSWGSAMPQRARLSWSVSCKSYSKPCSSQAAAWNDPRVFCLSDLRAELSHPALPCLALLLAGAVQPVW
jgi:hypothetical protein